MAIRVSIVVNEQSKNQIVSAYQEYQRDNKGEYILFFAKRPDLVVTIYTSKKADEYKVLFIGENAVEEAKQFDPEAKENEKKDSVKKASWMCLEDQIGSDEVGTGDFFGPICVCAAYVKASDIKRLKELGIDDSKRLSDEQIRKLGKILIKEFDYSQLSLNNEKYNELVDKDMNMNEMKAKMHNRVLFNLKMKHPPVKKVLIDQFVSKEKY